MTEKPTLPQNPPNPRLEKFSSTTWQYIAQTVSLDQRTQVNPAYTLAIWKRKENKKNPAYDPCANISQRPPKGSNKYSTKSFFFLSLKIPDLVQRPTAVYRGSGRQQKLLLDGASDLLSKI